MTAIMIEKHSDCIGRIRFSIFANNDYDPLSMFYQISGAVPYKIAKSDSGDYVYHYVRLCNLPSVTIMGVAKPPTYSIEFSTDFDEQGGANRMIIRGSKKECIVRYQWMYPGWHTFANEDPWAKADKIGGNLLP